MTKPIYDWTRYWQRWAGRASTPATDYLPEIGEALWGTALPDHRTLSQLKDVPCLILLGEPGIGKSTAVEVEKSRLIAEEVTVVVHDLKSYGSDSRLERKIFDAPEFAALTSGGSLVLFLDSLDEGRIVIGNIAPFLKDELRNRLRDERIRSRLKLRITCRSNGEWPDSFTEALKDIFGKEAVGIWHLCQLRRSDVALAVKQQELDGTSFLAEIDAANGRSLAAKPVTLDLLLRLKQIDGALPSRQVELYRQGMPELCRDPNKWRQEEGHVERLNTAKRLAIARQIAALSILCQRPFMQCRDMTGFVGTSDILALADICAPPASEAADGTDFTFDTRDVEEVLRTGLFRGAGDNRVSWAHQTYAEFLAAEYLLFTTWAQTGSCG